MLNHVFTLCCILLLFTGAVIVFTALLSVTFLNRKIQRFMWLGILFVVLGLVVVGIADVFGGVSYVTVTTLTDDRQLRNSREEDSCWIIGSFSLLRISVNSFYY